jgi:hypothetical protein
VAMTRVPQKCLSAPTSGKPGRWLPRLVRRRQGIFQFRTKKGRKYD